MNQHKAELEQKLVDAIAANEEGHTYAWGGGSILAIVLIVLLLIWIL